MARCLRSERVSILILTLDLHLHLLISPVKPENGDPSRAKHTQPSTLQQAAMHIFKKPYVQYQAKRAHLTEQNFATDGAILTGIYGNDSTVTFHNIEGTGKPQWVSFYYQSASPPPLSLPHTIRCPSNPRQTSTIWASETNVSTRPYTQPQV